MAKKINNPNTPVGSAAQKSPANAPKPAAAKTAAVKQDNGFLSAWYAPLVIVSAIAALTFLFFKTCCDNQFTNWDDLGYIITNQLIKDTSDDWLKNIFSIDHPVMGNYHPLTILLYALEYKKVGLEPWLYHFDSVITHVLVTIAVFYFVKKQTGRLVAATVAALLFGLHPMHVESVAWGAGRKDLLYGFFFVLTFTTYIDYIRSEGSKKMLWYILGIALFALSLLAKSVAVSLPVALFAVDYLENRKISIKLLIEKIPHFGLSLLFGLLSVKAQKDIGALGSLDASFNPLERIALGCYALWAYLWKAVVPVGLSNFYPYPLKVGDSLPGVYYIYPVIIIGIALLVWFFGRRSKQVLFGIAFFLINIVLLLQFIPVGGAILSDRYGYIPYLGLFFIVGWFVSELFEGPSPNALAKPVFGGVLVYCLVLGYMSNERCKDWYDSISLWKDDMEKHPEAPVAYFYIGQEYFTKFESSTNAKEKQMYADSSMYFFNMSVARKPDYLQPTVCIAELQRHFNQIDDAKITYQKAMKIDPKNEAVFLGLGVVYAIKQQYDSAEYAFKMALKLKPFSPEGHSNYANYLDIVGKLDSSLVEYGVSINQNPDAYIPYMNRARIFMRQNKLDEAMADYQKVIVLKPELPEPYYLRSKIFFQKGNKAQALKDVEKATSMGFTQVDQAYLQQLKQ